MRQRWITVFAAVAGIVVLAGVAAGFGGTVAGRAFARQASPVTVQGAPAPGTPSNPGAAPGYGPGGPGYGPGFGPGRMMYGGGRAFGRHAGFGAGVFALMALVRFLLVIALLVIAWKVITFRSLWVRPDAAVQTVRDRFARGEINEEEYRKRLVALS